VSKGEQKWGQLPPVGSGRKHLAKHGFERRRRARSGARWFVLRPGRRCSLSRSNGRQCDLQDRTRRHHYWIVGKGHSDPHLRDPIALAGAPNGHLLTSNGDAINADPTQPSEIVEFTKAGQFIGQYNIHQNQGGGFGVATSISKQVSKLAVVNDNANDVAVTTSILPQSLAITVG
jgi:hypothetical protein